MDQASSLRRFIPIPDESSRSIWEAFDRGWRTPYGRPKHVRVDAAKSLVQGDMTQGFEEDGTFVEQIAGEAPWQMGKTERHGGWLAEVVARVIRQVRPKDEAEWEACLRAAEVAALAHDAGIVSSA